MAVSVNKTKKFKAPIGRSASNYDCEYSPSTVVDALKKLKKVELPYYGIPDEKDDVFRRRIVVSSSPRNKHDTPEDIPDLSDVQVTNLPWLGHCTFKDSIRQFRNKHILASVVDIVRQIDGYLYRLKIELTDTRDIAPALKLINILPNSKYPAYQFLDVLDELSPEELMLHFGGVKNVPVSLIAEMTALGYHLEKDVFVHPSVEGWNARIACSLYGKLVSQ